SRHHHRSVPRARAFPMPTEPRRGRPAALIALTALLAVGAWWGVGRLWHRDVPLASGRSAYDHGNWEEAAGRARDTLKEVPADAGAARLLARSSARLGRDDSALALFRRLGPDDLEAEDHLLLGRILARHDRPDLARAQLWKAYRQDPTHGEALYELVRNLAKDD